MKIKTSELTDAALDWAVVIARGVKPADIRIAAGKIYRWSRDGDGNLTGGYQTGSEFLPSKMWESGGPIIEREGIELHGCKANGLWAQFYNMRLAADGKSKHYHRQTGPTPLIAAMRCFVASKLGDEVDVPEELSTQGREP